MRNATMSNSTANHSSPRPSFDVIVNHDAPDWQQYLSQKKEATIYHDPRWGRIFRDTCGGLPFFLTARDKDGRITGVLQLVGQRSLLFGSHLCSLPYFDASGVLAENEMASAALLGKAQELLQTHGYNHLEVRQFTSPAEDVQTRTDKVTLCLDLPASSEEMWGRLKGKVRTKVRKVRKNKMEFNKGGVELLNEFHGVYSRRMRDLGSPPHGKGFFNQIISEFSDETRLFVVRKEGRMLAAAFTLTDQWGFHVPWSASDTRFNHLGANRFLYWHLLAHAADSQAKRFDFGRSTAGSGTYTFKREWGAKPVQIYWQYFSIENKNVSVARPDSGKYKLMIRCWKKLPLPVAKIIGPWLIRKLT